MNLWIALCGMLLIGSAAWFFSTALGDVLLWWYRQHKTSEGSEDIYAGDDDPDDDDHILEDIRNLPEIQER